jgi:hypothetical protein
MQAVETLWYCTCYATLTEICCGNSSDIINIFFFFVFLSLSFDLNYFMFLTLFVRFWVGELA